MSAFANGGTVDLRPGPYFSLAYDNLSLTSDIGIAFGFTIGNAQGGAGTIHC